MDEPLTTEALIKAQKEIPKLFEKRVQDAAFKPFILEPEKKSEERGEISTKKVERKITFK